eukprot:TRINITY_DN28146_c0_g1_i2.p2 TRINITY_DN28146_c0_g1~~TRINITY_DN28146_c0_g1_i2.p2  ORF type:complete len:426 (+),score=84.69 TRINITY_DN28146_c0_g1_i2:30-1280(+)
MTCAAPIPTPSGAAVAGALIGDAGGADDGGKDQCELAEEYQTLEGTRAAVNARSWPKERCLPIAEFLQRQRQRGADGEATLVFDVRSPKEFGQGHIPGALSVPVLEDVDRSAVGTLYAQAGRDPAVELAVEAAFPGLGSILERVTEACRQAGARRRSFLLYCFRGGMRSQSVATFLRHHGFDVYTLEGGYKAFVSRAMDILESPKTVCVLGGATGSGKTEVLAELRSMGEQVIDLEALAHHKGSVFGHLGEQAQPTSEQFRNLVALEWERLDPQRFVFVEDEGSKIGTVSLPAPVYRRMRAAPLVVQLDVPFDLRADRSLALYGSYGAEALTEAVQQFRPLMGDKRTDKLLACLARGDLRPVCETALQNYDKSYSHHLHKGRDPETIVAVPVDTLDRRLARKSWHLCPSSYTCRFF